MKDKNFIRFNIAYFFANQKKVYLNLISGFILLLMYGFVIFILHSSYSYIPRPFHVFTYNLDMYYRMIYWFLIPFILINALAGQVYFIPINIRVRMNSFLQLLGFYFIQINFVALWGTLLIGIITIICFPLASKSINANDFIHIFWLLTFCYINIINIGLLLIILAKKFSEQISFFIVFIIALCDQYLFGHAILKSTKLLYTPVFSLQGVIFAILENIFLMLGLLLLLSIQIQKKEE